MLQRILMPYSLPSREVHFLTPILATKASVCMEVMPHPVCHKSQDIERKPPLVTEPSISIILGVIVVLSVNYFTWCQTGWRGCGGVNGRICITRTCLTKGARASGGLFRFYSQASFGSAASVLSFFCFLELDGSRWIWDGTSNDTDLAVLQMGGSGAVTILKCNDKFSFLFIKDYLS